MSYAQVTAANAPPLSKQPHPDPALLNTSSNTSLPPVDSYNEKVALAQPGFKEHPSTVTSEHKIPTDAELEARYGSTRGGSGQKHRSRKERAKEELGKAEAETHHLWEVAKTQILRPGVAGGILGIVNVGLLATAGYQFYTYPYLRSDRKAIGGTLAGALVLLAAEGALAGAYAQTEAGQQEAERAKREGDIIYRHAKEVVLRPGVMSGLLGALNVVVLGTAGYTFYTRPELRSDRKVASAVTIGILGLFLGEGFIAEQYRK